MSDKYVTLLGGLTQAFDEAFPDVGGGGATVSDSDPGAVGAGGIWIDTPGPPVVPNRVKVRNDADDGWLEIGIAAYDPGTGDYAIVTVSGTNITIRALNSIDSLVTAVSLDAGTGVEVLLADGAQLAVNDPNGAGLMTIDSAGTFNVFDPPGVRAALTFSPGQSASNKNVFALKNTAGTNIFQVRGDGTVHLPSGKSVVSDL